MKPICLILTGTSASGKTSLAKALSDAGNFAVVPASTSRKPRTKAEKSHYNFIKARVLRALKENGELLTFTTYRASSYGIARSDFQAALDSSKMPVLVVAPTSVRGLQTELDQNFPHVSHISVFMDEADDILDQRLKSRGSVPVDVVVQRQADRDAAPVADYRTSGGNLSELARTVETLVTMQDKSGLLPSKRIADLTSTGILLQGAAASLVQGASYDLRLGDEYFYAGQVRHLSIRQPFLMIEPYDYAIVTAFERAALPRDVAARFGLSIGLFCQGIILSNGPQVDPGFRGSLFCLLFNTSSRPVVLKRQQHFATIEFERLMESTEPYSGSKQDRQSIVDYLPINTAVGALNELKKEVERLQASNNGMQTFIISAISLILALVAVLVALL